MIILWELQPYPEDFHIFIRMDEAIGTINQALKFSSCTSLSLKIIGCENTLIFAGTLLLTRQFEVSNVFNSFQKELRELFLFFLNYIFVRFRIQCFYDLLGFEMLSITTGFFILLSINTHATGKFP